MNMKKRSAFWRGLAILTLALPAFAQYDAPLLGPGALDNLVNRIALYPDPLLAQVLAASTYPDQIADAARFADDHRYLRGDRLADVIAQANLPFDPSVQALLPFPDVLDMLAGDMGWTERLGNAVLAQRPDVMDAVQRMRRLASNYGYLRTGSEVRVVVEPAYIQILPVSPTFIWVPVYDPFVVFAPPRPGFFLGAAIGFRSGFVVGATFGGWGWGGGFNWASHTVIVNHVEWSRTWINRTTYVHNWGNWNGGHWAQYPARSVSVTNNVVINRNLAVNRYTSQTTNNSYRSSFDRPAQANAYVPSHNQGGGFGPPAAHEGHEYVRNDRPAERGGERGGDRGEHRGRRY